MGGDNAPVGNWIYAMGGLKKGRKKTKVCKAFAAAVKDWCAGAAGTEPPKRFDDVFYDKLGDELGEVGRETPILMKMTEDGAQAVGTLEQVAAGEAGTAAEQAAASSIVDAAEEEGISIASGAGPAGGAAGGFRVAMNGIAGSATGGAFGLKYADGQFPDKQLLEIKSPTDKFSEGQAEAENAASTKASGKPLAVASCSGCKKYVKCPSPYRCRKSRAAGLG